MSEMSRPPDTLWTQFTQQRLRAFRPVLTPRVIIPSYFVTGLVFLAVGVLLQKLADGVVELRQEYTNEPGQITFNVTKDMEPPIWVYYELTNFYQNHRSYVQSREDIQMRDGTETADKLSKCRPWITTDGRVNYPCGLVARSVFNDTFQLHKQDQYGGLDEIHINTSAQAIAWPADLDGRFRNIDPLQNTSPHLTNQELMNMWILKVFPPVTCKQVWKNRTDTNLPPVRVATKSLRVNTMDVEVPDCENYFGASPTCRFQPPCSSPNYKEVVVDDWGIESGHFITWMRIAALPTFRKLWGRIDTHLAKGTHLLFTWEDNFPVKRFGGKKTLVLSTSSVMGGQSRFLCRGYLAVGVCCVGIGSFYLYQLFCKPRPPGDGFDTP